MGFTRKSPLFMRVLLSALAAAFLAVTPQAKAAATLDFDQSAIPVNGTIIFDGGGVGAGTVTGSGIRFNLLTGFDTPFNDTAPLPCDGCLLSFTTGTLTSVAGGTYSFGPGGTVLMIGTIAPAAGVPPHGGTFGPIVTSGSFSFATLSITGTTFTFSGQGTDAKDTETVEYYFGPGSNVPPLDFTYSTTELGGTGVFGAGGSFTCADPVGTPSGCLTLADFSNTIPEPGTMLLMLLGLGGLAIRRFC